MSCMYEACACMQCNATVAISLSLPGLSNVITYWHIPHRRCARIASYHIVRYIHTAKHLWWLAARSALHITAERSIPAILPPPESIPTSPPYAVMALTRWWQVIVKRNPAGRYTCGTDSPASVVVLYLAAAAECLFVSIYSKVIILHTRSKHKHSTYRRPITLHVHYMQRRKIAKYGVYKVAWSR
ncbi:hypothetical protein J3F84DRAFT_215409 [Trichoderma pleuroticola]